MRYFLKLAYNGTSYHGWQRQPNALGVQQVIEDALSIITREKISIVGAGRTDTGVHARQMYAHFDYNEIKDETKFLSSLNKLVGNDISLFSLLKVKPEAHARFDALERSYSYYISLVKNPFSFSFSHRLLRMPDIEQMNQAATILLDTSDFTSFAKLHTDVVNNICNVKTAEWKVYPDKEMLVFTITANRFLRNMVRAVVGTLLEVGQHKLTLPQFKEVIARRDRCEAGMSMPAKGLFLEKIIYPQEIFI